MKSIISIFLVLCGVIASGQNFKKVGESCGMHLIQSGEKLGLMDLNDVVIIEPGDYDKFEFLENFGLIKAYWKDEFDLFYSTGSKCNGNNTLNYIGDFNDNGEVSIKSNAGYGLLDSEMKLIVPPVYDKVTSEAESFFGCCMNYVIEKDGKTGLMVGGNIVIPVEYSKMEKVNNYEAPIIVLTKDKKQGLFLGEMYEKEGKIALETEYDKIQYVDSRDDGTFFMVSKDGLNGVYGGINDLHFVVPVLYKKVDWENRKNFADIYSLIDVKIGKETQQIIVNNASPSEPIQSFGMNPVENGYIVTDKAGKFGVMDPFMNRFIIPAEYDKIIPYQNEFFAVLKNNKWGVLNERNEVKLEIRYDQLPDDIIYDY